jgi:hypothetical protein
MLESSWFSELWQAPNGRWIGSISPDQTFFTDLQACILHAFFQQQAKQLLTADAVLNKTWLNS